ncbi:hypothetical protein TELCIR_19702 [Teladorsagia circumcincta]|uniref:DnaK family protein n=1 Tax=Teladorsagia circumcincta TaxID=45464 RepID=A0A2G9TLJ4_TELCI|nr:hypothetical protein TELCIR_19702 [Teladorsagia circumcincta]
METKLQNQGAAVAQSDAIRGAVIGIDLGTTNSCVAVMEGKQAKSCSLIIILGENEVGEAVMNVVGDIK